ncbi:hypothetical protein I4U23_000329 [Adineta vaga]|nr:hypothetical protein I4U23_000329 [Adineta vaga]
MYTLDDCLSLLDGRLKQLTELIVEISLIKESPSIIHTTDDLPNLKNFSLKCYTETNQYDNEVRSLLRRMGFLEKLTLYLHIKDRANIIDNTHLETEILIYLPRLHSFTFYISTSWNPVDLFLDLPRQDNQSIITNIWQQPVANIVHYIGDDYAVHHILSLPFTFNRLEYFGNIFPDTIFNYVTFLSVQDRVPFNHEFFVPVARSFPSLITLHVTNTEFPSRFNYDTYSADSGQLYSIAEYPSLSSLDLRFTTHNYAEQFLNETMTFVPCLVELTISYRDLEKVTNNFTRDQTRRNCAKIKRLITVGTWVASKDFYFYFPFQTNSSESVYYYCPIENIHDIFKLLRCQNEQNLLLKPLVIYSNIHDAHEATELNLENNQFCLLRLLVFQSNLVEENPVEVYDPSMISFDRMWIYIYNDQEISYHFICIT